MLQSGDLSLDFPFSLPPSNVCFLPGLNIISLVILHFIFEGLCWLSSTISVNFLSLQSWGQPLASAGWSQNESNLEGAWNEDRHKTQMPCKRTLDGNLPRCTLDSPHPTIHPDVLDHKPKLRVSTENPDCKTQYTARKRAIVMVVSEGSCVRLQYKS